MPGVILSVEVIDNSGLKLLRGQINQMKKEALQEVAAYFHEELFPSRFTPGNDSRQRHEKRNQVYKDRIKKRFGQGQGKFVDLLLSGKTKRRTSLRKITGTSSGATLTVETPAYFRRPFVGSFRDSKGRQKRVDHQPDKVAELKQFTPEEIEKMREKYAEVMGVKIKNPPARKAQNRDSTGRFIKA